MGSNLVFAGRGGYQGDYRRDRSAPSTELYGAAHAGAWVASTGAVSAGASTCSTSSSSRCRRTSAA